MQISFENDNQNEGGGPQNEGGGPQNEGGNPEGYALGAGASSMR